jgi:diacylglycerol kinase family enzyme
MLAFCVIANPVAGKGAGLRQAEHVRDLLREGGLDFDLVDTQLAHPQVSSLRARRITIRAQRGLNSHADGEIYMIDGQQIDLEMLPRQIQVICDSKERP